LAAENDGEGGWALPSRHPSQLCEIINSGEINEQVGHDEGTEGQKQLRDGQEIEMSDTDAESCSETDILPNHSNDLLNMIWKMMQEDKIEQERIRQEAEEKQEKVRREDKAGSERNRKEDKERLEQVIKQIRDDVE
jgi:hypothetical protein